jgi:hypothetical protein
MAVSIAGIIAVLPELIIAGLIAFYLNRILSYEKMRLTFKLDRGWTFYDKVHNYLSRNSGQNESSPKKDIHSPFIYRSVDKDLKSISVALITISAWILILLSLIGVGKSSAFLPIFSGILNIPLYGILLVMFLTSVMASLSIRVAVDKGLRIMGTAIAIVLTVLFFYLPSMKWFTDTPRSIIVTAVIIYFAAFFVVILAYIFWWYIRPRKAFRISLYTSVTTYAMIVVLMLLKDFRFLH